jgi:hypothetical protein
MNWTVAAAVSPRPGRPVAAGDSAPTMAGRRCDGTIAKILQRGVVEVFLRLGNLAQMLRSTRQNFSPAGVTSPLLARAIPTTCDSLEFASGR